MVFLEVIIDLLILCIMHPQGHPQDSGILK